MSRTPRPATPFTRPEGIAYGGDYNPEQWPEEVWTEDVALMREAGVNLVSVGIFSWGLLEPRPGRFEFGWLDRVLGLLDAGGIAVDLATPTAAPPPWFLRRHPEARLVGADGNALGGGGRQSFCPSSTAYAEASARVTEELGRRYAGHPALAMWHAHNEYAGVNPACHCPASAAAFRDWLRKRYADLAELNAAWGTVFWSQVYGDWDEIETPMAAPTVVNPAQLLDFRRFSGDAHLANFQRERDILHRLSPGIPVTTNFMIANCKELDYWRWAPEVDLVGNSHYLKAEEPDNHIELAMCADLTRSLAGGEPWLLLEHSTGAVNWQPRNIAKRSGELRRNSMSHLARGADAVMFFQWRAGRYGAEKFHSAMLPHGGTETRIWRDVVDLGAELGALGELRGSRVAADVAMMWDWQSWWALELDWRPTVDLDYRDEAAGWYDRLWRDGLTVDFVRPESDLDGYPLVVVPSLYLTTPAAAAKLKSYVDGGGTLVVGYFSGIVDANDAIHPGGHPGALRELLGLTVEEFLPLRAGEHVATTDGGTGTVWTERILPEGAATVAAYTDGPAAGGPAVTRNAHGAGHAWYVSTRLRGEDLDRVLDGALADAGVVPREGTEGVEVVRRVGADAAYLVAINHTAADAVIAEAGTELATGEDVDALVVPAGGVRVLRRKRPSLDK